MSHDLLNITTFQYKISYQGRHSISGDFSRASMVLMHSVLQEDHGGSSLRMVSG